MKALFGFDFDGTLTPIVSHPDKAKVPSTTIKQLQTIQKKYEANILILSGRPLSYLKSKFPRTGFYLAGNHGFECQGPKTNYVHPQAKAAITQLKKIKKWVSPFLKEFKGCWLEDKKYTFSIHYRALPKKEHERFCRKLKAHLKSFPTGVKKIKLRPGKCVLEIRPQIDWDKGKMYLWLQKKLKLKPKQDFFFYAGDDVTDEDVFKVLKKLKGISLYVGTNIKQTKANYFVKDQKDFKKCLKMIFINK